MGELCITLGRCSAILAVNVSIQFELPHDKTNKMACTPSENSDQPGHLPSVIRVFAVLMKKAWVLSYPLSAQRRLWSSAQADLSLRWAHMPFCWFCHEAVHLVNVSLQLRYVLVPLRSLLSLMIGLVHFYFMGVWFILFIIIYCKTSNIKGKQGRPRSDAAFIFYWAGAHKNLQNHICTSEDSDQLTHPQNLVSLRWALGL